MQVQFSDSLSDLKVFTIGHSNHAIETFLNLLTKNKIDVLVDTRSSPYSKFAPHFNQNALAASIRADKKKYLFLGTELGGKPKNASFYDDEGYVLYWKIAQSEMFNSGIERLRNGIRMYRVALLCSEEDPKACHRRLLVGRVLKEHGVALLHIRANGSLQTEQDLELCTGATARQMSFFSQGNEDEQWRSIQSVSQRKPLLNSSSQ